MSKSFFILFFASLAGVLIASISTGDAAAHHWLGLVFGLTPLCIYHLLLLRRSLLSPGEVDSIYYFGFLVTIITLVSTAIAIGLADKLPGVQWILLQFGLGLVATGYALFARLHLMSRSSGQVEMNIVEANQRLAESVTSVANQFDQASFQVTAFISQLDERLEDIAKKSERKMEDSLANSLTAFEEASQGLLKKYMAHSLSAMDGAARSFEFSVNNLISEVDRIKNEAGAVSFAQAADEINNFSREIKKCFSSISSETSEASSTAADAVSRLTSTLRKVQRVADNIGEKLQGLDGLGVLLSEIERAALGLSEVSDKSRVTALSLDDLQIKSHQAARNLAHSVIEPLSSDGAGDGLKTLTRTLPADASKLLLTVTELNERFIGLTDSVKKSEMMLTAGRDALKVPPALQTNYAHFSDALNKMSSDLSFLRTSLSELQVAVASARSNIASSDINKN